ncbi:iron-sulfur cluster co-chaperone HscB C-terminal domain-containing protein [Taibaiella soli]|uniref:iron-sulfur cluster co-chaperone HscB C-terminal domain-containing protein n=1 Tax=Taibaiella soli TaxID=1649169 RepID=UPI001403AD6C|nr:iron-sulfur cluster co-chaperone HscB C-terminal domain-containing protein [Taibaiella soli]
MKPQFKPDSAKVKSKFYELSRKYHPDRFTMADHAHRAEALRMAAINNDAYKTLNNLDATMAYVLQLNGLLEQDEKYNLPPAFLMEMMELNEAITEYEMDEENESAKKNALAALEEQMSGWDTVVAPLLSQFDNGEQTPDLLPKIKDFYFRRKYLLRIQQRVLIFAAH